jgi:hypothetical protein
MLTLEDIDPSRHMSRECLSCKYFIGLVSPTRFRCERLSYGEYTIHDKSKPPWRCSSFKSLGPLVSKKWRQKIYAE